MQGTVKKKFFILIFIIWIIIMAIVVINFLDNLSPDPDEEPLTSHLYFNFDDDIVDNTSIKSARELDQVINIEYLDNVLVIKTYVDEDILVIINFLINNNIIIYDFETYVVEFFIDEQLIIFDRPLLMTPEDMKVNVTVRLRQYVYLEINLGLDYDTESGTDNLSYSVLEGTNILEILFEMVENENIIRDGYRIAGFLDSELNLITKKTIMPSTGIQVTIIWIYDYYIITLNLNGGHIQWSNKQTKELSVSSEYNLYEYLLEKNLPLVKQGHRFVNWTLNEKAFTENYMNDFELEREFTLVATWETLTTFDLEINLNVTGITDAYIEVIGLPSGVERIDNVFRAPLETSIESILYALEVTSASHYFCDWSINDDNPDHVIVTVTWSQDVRTFELEIDYGIAHNVNTGVTTQLNAVPFGADEADIRQLLSGIEASSDSHVFGSWNFTGTVNENNLVVTIYWSEIKTNTVFFTQIRGDAAARVNEITTPFGTTFTELRTRIMENAEGYINLDNTHRISNVTLLIGSVIYGIIMGNIGIAIYVERVYSLVTFDTSDISGEVIAPELIEVNTYLLSSLEKRDLDQLDSVGYYVFIHWKLDDYEVTQTTMVPNDRNIILYAIFEDERGGFQFIRVTWSGPAAGALHLYRIRAYVGDENVTTQRADVDVVTNLDGGQHVTWSDLVNDDTPVLLSHWAIPTITVNLRQTRPLSHIIITRPNTNAGNLIVEISVCGEVWQSPPHGDGSGTSPRWNF